MKNFISWFDGKFLPSNECLISPMTHSLCYGTSVFEGISCYNDNIFKIDEHIKRLFISCCTFKLKLNYTSKTIKESIKELIKLNNHSYCYIKIIVFLDDTDPSFMAIGSKTRVYITSFPFQFSTFDQKVSLQISRWKKPSKYCHPYSAKTSSTYSLSYLAFKEKDKKYTDILFVSEQGYICEASGANIFFFNGSELLTPKEETCLSGITRTIVINEIAKILKINVVIRNIHEQELHTFSSAFLCGTAVEIVFVKSINNIKYSENKEVFMIKKIYNNMVNNENEERVL